jgi:hypothetical protein
VQVEVDGPVVDGVHDDSSGARVTGAGNGAEKGITQQISTEAAALFGPIEGTPGQQQDRNRVGLASPPTRRRAAVLDAAHRQRVVANHPPGTTEHPRRRCASGRCYRCGASQPIVELDDTAVERRAIVPGRVQELDRPEAGGRQALGMRLSRLNSATSSGTTSVGSSSAATKLRNAASESSRWLARSSSS